MPRRPTPLVNGEFYHIFNHGIDERDICSTEREYRRFLLATWFYLPQIVQMKLSHYLVLGSDVQQQMIEEINKKPRSVLIHSFSIMPNHYHFLIEQVVDGGISAFIGNLQNSYTRYYNTKQDRKGSLFLTPFRSKRISTEEQFLHVTRYIHLNRYTSGIVSNLDDLRTDPYSSLPYYLQSIPIEKPIVYTKRLGGLFRNPEDHWQFIANQADYQRQLDHIKHLMTE